MDIATERTIQGPTVQAYGFTRTFLLDSRGTYRLIEETVPGALSSRLSLYTLYYEDKVIKTKAFCSDDLGDGRHYMIGCAIRHSEPLYK